MTLLVGFVADLALHRALKWRDEQRLARYEKKMQLRNNMDRFEQMAEERRKSAAVVLGEQHRPRGKGSRRGRCADFLLCGSGPLC